MKRTVRAAVAAAVLGAVVSGAGPAGAAEVSGTERQFIGIMNFDFRPDPATVSPGEQVVVVNGDGIRNGIPHTLTSVDSEFNTGVFLTVRAFDAPTVPGEYPYLCLIHPFMRGTLVVSG